MKQIIVLVAMVILGVSISGMVFQFGDSAKSITDSANDRIKKMMTTSAIQMSEPFAS